MLHLFPSINNSVQSIRFKTLNPCISLSRLCHFKAKRGFDSLNQTSSVQNSVAVFWDLDNKPPNAFPPFEAVVKLKTAASSFGVVRSMVAYANQHSFSYVPKAVREQRRERKLLNQLENKGVIKSIDPYVCKVCGRRFYTNEKLVNHFKQIHEREHQKRVNQIGSARGSRRVKLVGKYSMKMEKYKNAAREVLTPKVGYGLADELKRAGFWVGTVSNRPQAADVALRDHMVDVMDKRKAECLMLVSDDSDFVGVLKEAKLRCLKTVVVGDADDGALKRVADAGFSWTEILKGKAKKEAVSVVGKWKDRDILKKLEWTYDPEVERKLYDSEGMFDDESEDLDFDGSDDGNSSDYIHKEDSGAWWELDTESDADSSKSQ
ncbi:hypothetical protein ERO13_D11G210100v2 [Gossypium hirsutum]|nr:hypothetical protein ERO13_D11G210100v2 [Gossypium hirsutum]